LSGLDYLSRLGGRLFQLVCDDFIGDPAWAETVMDRILAWEERTGFRPGLYVGDAEPCATRRS
jgi:hypothetical protein